MKVRLVQACGLVIFLFVGQLSFAAPVSEATDGCLICHRAITPGIVADWESSRHATVTPAEALEKSSLELRVSAPEVPDSLANIVVGCAECHGLNAEDHPDSFDHNGNLIHTVVSPPDCGVCHPSEVGQYQQNIMACAHVNLSRNDIYQSMMKAVNGVQRFEKMSTVLEEPEQITQEQSCYYCHGTRVGIGSYTTRETIFGEMEFPQLTGWPNQGVGRINPDSTMGSCTPCHARHAFSIEVARKPYTCSECHKGPDVPAYKVYKVSKMGNIYSSLHSNWNFDAVPWKAGEHFTAPTCAVCHVSLLVDSDDEVVVPRTHQMDDRLHMRLFGLIYAHPHPRDCNTHYIRNKAGLQLPTELNGEMVSSALINETEQERRKELMKKVCLQCHSRQWTDSHFENLDHVVEITNEMTRTATQIMLEAWNSGAATGLAADGNIFDEALERKWVQQWLYYGNSTRYSAAMAGADYGVFANGRWHQSRNIQDMLDWLEMKRK